MMAGMDYHHENFCSLVNQLAQLPFRSAECRQLERRAHHEVVAYLNRVGQFYYFGKSVLVRGLLRAGKRELKDQIPSLISSLPFRHKITAHRSIDFPKECDTGRLQEIHAISIGPLGGQMFVPRQSTIGVRPEELMFYPDRFYYRAYQLILKHDPNVEPASFVPERDHHKYILECYNLIELLLQ